MFAKPGPELRPQLCAGISYAVASVNPRYSSSCGRISCIVVFEVLKECESTNEGYTGSCIQGIPSHILLIAGFSFGGSSCVGGMCRTSI